MINQIKNLNKITLIVFLSIYFVVDSFKIKAQESQSLFSVVYLINGDILTGSILSSNDTILELNEWRMGVLLLQQKDVDHVQSVLKNAKVIIVLNDNARYTGDLVAVNNGQFVLNTILAGEVLIPRQEIKNIDVVKRVKEVTVNPNATRYFFAPSAIPIEKGSGYYQNAYLLSNSVNFGLTKNFSLGGGVIIPILFYLTPKIGYQVRKNLYVGAGLIAASTFIPGATISGGIPFGLLTCGNTETNFTIGIGYGMLWNDERKFQQTHYPITTINGVARLSNRLQLVSENWIVPVRYTKTEELDDGYFDNYGNWISGTEISKEVTELYMAMSLGLRVMVTQRSTVDFAPVYLFGVSNAPLIPYLDFAYKF